MVPYKDAIFGLESFKKPSYQTKLYISLYLVLGLCALPSRALAQELDYDPLQDLDLAGLGEVKVTSVSKTEEEAFRSSAAIFVLNNEDILRSGATTIPDLLRFVPGLQVAQMTSNKWAVSSRGFNDSLANKLLVLIDGRSVYTPQYSGVFWDAIDLVLEDIERIEVIRGPGASLWGANAVNGVINITTKSAKDTQGNLLSAAYGTNDQPVVSVRHGGKVGDNLHYRAYAKYFNRDETLNLQGQGMDNGWYFDRAGFRMDYDASAKNFFTAQGDIYYGVEDVTLFIPSYLTPPTENSDNNGDMSGGNLLGRWHYVRDSGDLSQFQFYYDRLERYFSNIEININQLDFDYQYTHYLSPVNTLIWGTGYRHVWDDFESTKWFSYNPDEATEDLFTGFVQLKHELVPDTLSLTIGTKLEQNDYTGLEVLPNARLSYYPTSNQTIWAAVSQAVRTPSRSEDDISLVVGAIPGRGYIRWVGDPNMQSEELTAYELGYRIRPKPNLSFDIAAFYNDYSKLRTTEAGPSPFSDTAVALFFDNKAYGETYGGEIVADWNVFRNWNLSASYSLLDQQIHKKSDSRDTVIERDEGKSPEQQFYIASRFDVDKKYFFDTTLFYVDSLPQLAIDDYWKLNARLAYRPVENVELSLVAEHLLDDQHSEFGKALNEVQAEIRRNIFAQVRCTF